MSVSHLASRHSLAIATYIIVLCVSGCGSSNEVPIAAVSGRVTHGDQPVAEGIVCFMSAKGFGASAPLQADGSYQLQSQHGAGIPLGAYKVIVQPPEMEIVESDRSAPRKSDSSNIPRKYQDFATSGLEMVIGEGRQTFDIQLTP
ncbi:hypothetical protein [Blastopirellula marina]|uniref:Carboxypeptidase regulatory-like domain-containing protein n=1 Tax=Blastopirellula marina DSM 3645 TaxID=314230 RepID=A3ZM33_9BACT|nr:hypothetical protein [Blastopirellula marina]EAQ82816.1 hypothetical protein DSM3645_10462 [Blastopirellula marina DSM 3645]